MWGRRMTMAMFALLTRLSPDAVPEPGQVEELGRQVERRIHEQCPEAKWITSYAVLGPCDYLDIFEAPDDQVAAKVALIVRSFGRSTTEMWTVQPYDRFVRMAHDLQERGRGRAAA
jgi:uncharacterized protein with GYD domain